MKTIPKRKIPLKIEDFKQHDWHLLHSLNDLTALMRAAKGAEAARKAIEINLCIRYKATVPELKKVMHGMGRGAFHGLYTW